MSTVHIVLPNDIDDPQRPSGGNHYDRQVCHALSTAGWTVVEHAVAGAWPRPSATDRGRLGDVLGALPDGAVVLLDGLIAATVPDILAPHAQRLHLVVLAHMPAADHDPDHREPERETLALAGAVVATSAWCGRRLVDLHGLAADRVHVARPGVDAAPLASGSGDGTALLCVAAVTIHKGHDLLVRALAELTDLPWTCACVGSVDRDPAFVDQLRQDVRAAGLADRIDFVGTATSRDLDLRYAGADLLVQPSRREAYGMVVTEALARGTPVVVTAVDGLPEAVGHTSEGRPGLLVTPEDPAALAAGLRRWLTDADLRHGLRRCARERRTWLTGWDHTARQVATALSAAMANVAVGR
jgi:glycosyltransferase involved in cell wall biosynthesis